MGLKKIFGMGKKTIISLIIVSNLLGSPAFAERIANQGNPNSGYTSEQILQSSNRLKDLRENGSKIIDSLNTSYQNMIDVVREIGNSGGNNNYPQLKDSFTKYYLNFDDSCNKLDANLKEVIGTIAFLNGLKNSSNKDLNISSEEFKILIRLDSELLELRNKLNDYNAVCKGVNDNITSLAVTVLDRSEIGEGELKKRSMVLYRLITEGDAREFWDLANDIYKN